MRFKDGLPFIVVEFKRVESLKNGLEDDIFERFCDMAIEHGVVIERSHKDNSTSFIIKPFATNSNKEKD